MPTLVCCDLFVPEDKIVIKTDGCYTANQTNQEVL